MTPRARSRSTWAKWLFLVSLAAFLGKQTALILHEGGAPLSHSDGFSEANSDDGAQILVQQGWAATAALPTYPRLKMDTPVTQIQSSQIYTHYLPGPDYVLALGYRLFGISTITFQWMRLIPVFHLALAFLFLVYACNQTVFRGFPAAGAMLIAILGFTSGMRSWAITLHGHAYTSAYCLMALSSGLLCAKRKFPWGAIAAAGVLLGFLSMQMLMTSCFIVFFAPIVGSLLADEERTFKLSRHYPALFLSLCVGVGLTAAYALHFAQVAWVFGGGAAFQDQLGAMLFRSTGSAFNWIQLFHFYNEDCNGTFGIGSFPMLWIALLLGCAVLPERKTQAFAVLIAFFASYAWILVMKQHSTAHRHVNPRVFLLLFTAFLIFLGALVSARMRSNRA